RSLVEVHALLGVTHRQPGAMLVWSFTGSLCHSAHASPVGSGLHRPWSQAMSSTTSRGATRRRGDVNPSGTTAQVNLRREPSARSAPVSWYQKSNARTFSSHCRSQTTFSVPWRGCRTSGTATTRCPEKGRAERTPGRHGG